MPNLLQSEGSRDAGKETSYASLMTSRFFLGFFSNRNPLRAPTGAIYEKFYHLGTTDALIDGVNVELSNRLTICRRPGNTAGLSGVLFGGNLPTTSPLSIPDTFYSFHEIGGNVRVFVDTPFAPYLWTLSQFIPITEKPAGVAQSFFQGIAQTLYFSDSKEQLKWQDFGVGVPGNTFATVTNVQLTNNVATYTSVNNFAVGQTVTVSNTATSSGLFNIQGMVTAVTPNSFSLALFSGNVGSTSDGGFASGVWNWGIAAPTAGPTLDVVESGDAAVMWQANTFFSTMGIIADSNGNGEQLISVNADGSNVGGTVGLSANGSPAWNQTPGGTTTDNTITWTNRGPIGAWAPTALYNWSGAFGTTANPAVIYDPASNAVFIQANPSTLAGTTGSFKPNFVNVPGSFIQDGSVHWGCIGSPGNFSWIPNHAYTGFTGSLNSNSEVIEPLTTLPAPNNQTVYLQTTPNGSSGGTSNSSFSTPAWSTVAGQQTVDNQLIWVNLGSLTRTNSTAYTAWTQPKLTPFGVINVSNIFYVCTVSGVTAGSTPTFNSAYGSTTIDGTVTWVSVGDGTNALWFANSLYYLPQVGFNPPQPSDPFGGSEVTDSNSNIEFAITSGFSGVSSPSWNLTKGGTTTDHQVTWINNGPVNPNSLAYQFGYTYAYAYKARAASDAFVTEVPPLGTIPLGLPTGSADGSVSTASSTASFTGGNPGAVINVSGIGSTDPQVDTIEIYRSDDGGAAPNLFLLTDIPNPAPIGGVAQPWSFQDFMPDNANAQFPGLDTEVIAPLGNFNNPPPVGMINQVQHLQRIFGSVGATVFASEGPLVAGAGQPPGNGYTAFSPANFWTFPSPVTRLVSTTIGLLVFTTSDLYIIAGGPNILSVYSNILIPGLGLTSFNALTVEGGLIYLLSADNQQLSLDPNMGVSETGYPIGDQLNNFSPSSAYLAAHIQGSNDKALFVADGSTGWFRCNPQQAPDSAISGPVWSPKANIVGGCGAIASLEVSPGRHALVIGGISSGKPILVRDSNYNVFTDSGSSYPANFTFGSIVLAQPGQMAELGFITCEFIRTGASPKVLVLLDELKDTLLHITEVIVSGPNAIYFYNSINGNLPQTGMTLTISGLTDSTNNGTFVVTGTGFGSFTVHNISGVTRLFDSGIATRFEDLSGYILATGEPPQDPPQLYGVGSTPTTIFAPRYYFEQSINGTVPQPAWCRHMQIKVDYGSTDEVQNEILSQTIWGRHWQEA